jgi:hypothetical protein
MPASWLNCFAISVYRAATMLEDASTMSVLWVEQKVVAAGVVPSGVPPDDKPPLPGLAPLLAPEEVLPGVAALAAVPAVTAAAFAAPAAGNPPPPPPPPPPQPVSTLAPTASRIALLCRTFNKKHLQNNKSSFLRGKSPTEQTFFQTLS